MSNFTLSFVLTLLLCSTSHGQTNQNIKLLQQKIQLADSVLLISHEITFGFAVTEDKPIGDKSKELPAPKYFIKGKLNGRIINEQALLTDTAKLTLTKILVRQVLKKKWTPSTCDQPRHSIIVYKNNKQSYIDICFGCRRVHTSKDIDFSEFYMDEKKWEQLKNFFKNNGLTQVFNEYNE